MTRRRRFERDFFFFFARLILPVPTERPFTIRCVGAGDI